MKMRPEETPDDDHELVIERVCAIDVAKASGKVCVRLPRPSRGGRRIGTVWDVEASTGAVTELDDHLVGAGIEKVTVESTSDYWRIWFYLLESAGLAVQLVNAREVSTSRDDPRPTSWTRCGWPSSPRNGCCGQVSCLRHRSGRCGTTRDCGSI